MSFQFPDLIIRTDHLFGVGIRRRDMVWRPGIHRIIFQTAEMNYSPRSEVISEGIPWRQKPWWMKSWAVSVEDRGLERAKMAGHGETINYCENDVFTF